MNNKTLLLCAVLASLLSSCIIVPYDHDGYWGRGRGWDHDRGGWHGEGWRRD